MANQFLGEVTVQGGDKTYTLRCDFNAMAEFETATGKEAMTAFARVETGKVSVLDMRAMMWSFMRRHHPEASIEEAGDLLSNNINALRDVIQATMPAKSEVRPLEKPVARRKSAAS